MELVNYEEFLLKAGEKDELGLKTIVTYSILTRLKDGVMVKVFDLMRKGIAKAIFERGAKPKSLTMEVREDGEIEGKDLTALIETEGGASLQDFAGFIYTQAANLHSQVGNWENKPLWGYVKWWLSRKVGRVETH